MTPSSPQVRTYRYGQAAELTGLSIGATHFLPRGIKKTDYATKGFFDVWMPILAPSAQLIESYKKGAISFMSFAARYRREMAKPGAKQALRLVAALSRSQPVNLGCFCENESHCHRSLLPALIERAASDLPPPRQTRACYASPACSMSEIDD